MSVELSKMFENVIAALVVAFLLAIPTYVGYTYSQINSLQREVAELKQTLDGVIEKKISIKADEFTYGESKKGTQKTSQN